MTISEERFDLHDEIVHGRYPRFQRWQVSQSTLIYLFCKTLITPSILFLQNPNYPSTTLADAVRYFGLFQLSLEMLCTSLLLVWPLPPTHRLSPIQFIYGIMFFAFCGMSAMLGVYCISSSHDFGALGQRAFVAGLIYASNYRRCNLSFPIIQGGLFFRYKLGIHKSLIYALKLSSIACLLTLIQAIITNYYKCQLAVIEDLIMEQVGFYLAFFVVYLCWELNRNLLQVFLTERMILAPPKGSAASQRDPNGHLLAVLEDTSSGPLVRCLAYYDLHLVCGSYVDTWRRDALYEESPDTYRRLIVVCQKPLQQLILDLTSEQQCSDPFYDFQVLAWCAHIASSLIIFLKKVDRYWVTRFYKSRADAISTLVCSLIVVETSIGKENLLEVHRPFHPLREFSRMVGLRAKQRRIKTATFKKNSPYYIKASSLARIFKDSLYQVVSTLHEDLVASSNAGLLQQNWITSDQPLYGSCELLAQKLQEFLEI